MSNTNDSVAPGSEKLSDLRLQLGFDYRLRFTRDAFDPENPTLRDVLETQQGYQHRVLVFLDQNVDRGSPELADRIEAYLSGCGDRLRFTKIARVSGGEACKNDLQHVENLLRTIHDAKLCRHSYVVVVGGGALLDAVGFAAAIAHRGIRLVRCPTTTLGQGDSGVGVKNGVNAFGKKNYLGVFTPPWAVVNDLELLRTLPDRDWRSGFAEAVKVALVKNGDFFQTIRRSASQIRARDASVAFPVLNDSAHWHLRHIVYGGDPYEVTRARPLDFGHWAAHKMEHMSGYRLRHGEAVAIGVSLDAVYSSLTRTLSWEDTQQVLECLEELGFATYDEVMDDTKTLLLGLDEFREHLGGELTVTLLDGLGKASDVHQFEAGAVLEACSYLARRQPRAARPNSSGADTDNPLNIGGNHAVIDQPLSVDQN